MFPMHVGIVVMDQKQLAAVYAVLAGTAIAAISAPVGKPPEPAPQATAPSSAGVETLAPENQASAGTGPVATTAVSPSDEVDAGGHPWSADLHASTKGKTKDGYWRMKVGVSRPDPLPGFSTGGAPDTGTSTETGTASATSQAATGPEIGQAVTGAPAEDDEFVAFRNAAAASDATDTAAAASVPTARQFSDADLGALCNQAAVKLGDPAPIKEIIAKFVPEGQTQHSRNIPADKREEFAQAVETKADIKFAA
jgi:hypothetical protein